MEASSTVSVNYLWEIGIQSFNEGDTPETGMKKIWGAMAPDSDLLLLVKIVVVLWADTFWAKTKINIWLLARNLRDAIGVRLTDAIEIAESASTSLAKELTANNNYISGHLPKQSSKNQKLSLKQIMAIWNKTNYLYFPDKHSHVYGPAQSYNTSVKTHEPALLGYYSEKGFSFTLPNAENYFLVVAEAPDIINIKSSNPFIKGQNNTLTDDTDHDKKVYVLVNNTAYVPYRNDTNSSETVIFEVYCNNLPVGSLVTLAADDHQLRNTLSSTSIVTCETDHFKVEGTIPASYQGRMKLIIMTPKGTELHTTSSIKVKEVWYLGVNHSHYKQAANILKDSASLIFGEPILIEVQEYFFVSEAYGESIH